MNKINILDTTLRDGSYAIDFRFTTSDTAAIAAALESVGVEYIEVGHGVGLNASASGYGASAATDEEYMIAAEKTLTRATYGMFCIPGIARLQDVDLAASHRMGFIRVGTNVTEVPESEPFIRRAKELGLFVAANYMKSYALSPLAFAEQVKRSEAYGADMVYIVDSAGSMFPDDIRRYFDAIRSVSNLAVGFHGHDNLGFAVANSIAAADMGIQFIDASLQGLGRSAGNACTEMLVAALLKRGYELPIDFLKLLDIGERYVQPMLTGKGRMPLDTVAGYAEFHSSYMPKIQTYAAKYNVHPARLIIELCKIDRVNAHPDVLEKLASELKGDVPLFLGQYGFNRYVGGEQDDRNQ